MDECLPSICLFYGGPPKHILFTPECQGQVEIAIIGHSVINETFVKVSENFLLLQASIFMGGKCFDRYRVLWNWYTDPALAVKMTNPFLYVPSTFLKSSIYTIAVGAVLINPSNSSDYFIATPSMVSNTSCRNHKFTRRKLWTTDTD